MSFLPVYLFVALAWLAIFVRTARPSRPRGVRAALFFLFGVYLCFVIYFTLTPFIFELGRSHWQINLVPWVETYLMVKYGVPSAAWYNIIGNLVMLMPFGFLVPMIYANMGAWWRVCAAAFTASLSIETLQLLFAVRIFDVDDVILNTCGAVLGYVVLKIAVRRWTVLRVASASHASEASLGVTAAPCVASNATGSVSASHPFELTLAGIVGFAGVLGLVIGVVFAATVAST